MREGASLADGVDRSVGIRERARLLDCARAADTEGVHTVTATTGRVSHAIS